MRIWFPRLRAWRGSNAAKVSLFPLDLPDAGDWYLWGVFALDFDVGFFAEAMVNRRFHGANMTTSLCKEAALAMFSDNLAVLLRILERAQKGFRRVVRSCKRGVAKFLRQLTPAKPGDVIQTTLTLGEFENHCQRVLPIPKTKLQFGCTSTKGWPIITLSIASFQKPFSSISAHSS